MCGMRGANVWSQNCLWTAMKRRWESSTLRCKCHGTRARKRHYSGSVVMDCGHILVVEPWYFAGCLAVAGVAVPKRTLLLQRCRLPRVLNVCRLGCFSAGYAHL
eukprot:5125455-Amphidinium_carterae.1